MGYPIHVWHLNMGKDEGQQKWDSETDSFVGMHTSSHLRAVHVPCFVSSDFVYFNTIIFQ